MLFMSLSMRSVMLTVSKAFVRSSCVMIVFWGFCLFRPDVMLAVMCCRAVVVECSGLKPCCCVVVGECV